MGRVNSSSESICSNQKTVSFVSFVRNTRIAGGHKPGSELLRGTAQVVVEKL